MGAVKLTGVVMGMWFPKNWDEEICNKMDKKRTIEKLTIAGALIAAEIDRLNFIEREATTHPK